MKKYISDIITKEQISQWKSGDRILISAGTGSGKTNFILHDLYEHCKLKKKKILLLVNRSLLKEQLIKENYGDVVHIKLYQSIEQDIITKSYNDSFTFEEYDFIVFDEAHYFFTDSSFSKKTDLILKLAVQDYPTRILIFMTATPDNLVELNVVKNTLPPYLIRKDTSFINNLYFYRSKKGSDRIVKLICKSVPDGEKLIYFGSATTAFGLYKEFEDSIFLCAEGNDALKDYSDKEAKTNISKNEKFDKKYLFTTRVLDNGISLSDKSITHIVIDDSIDPIITLQMMGRKRIIDESDKINLYIRDHPSYTIVGKLNILQNIIKLVNEYKELGKTRFLAKYKKRNVKLFDSFLDNDGEINRAKELAILYSQNTYQQIVKMRYGYKQYLCDLLGIKRESVKSANQEYKELQAKEVLDKYVGRKLFKEEQLQFKKELLTSIFDPRKNKPIGLQTIRSILEDSNLQYYIENRQEKSAGDKRNMTYWMVVNSEN